MDPFVLMAFSIACLSFVYAVSADSKIKKLEKRIDELERNKWFSIHNLIIERYFKYRSIFV